MYVTIFLSDLQSSKGKKKLSISFQLFPLEIPEEKYRFREIILYGA